MNTAGEDFVRGFLRRLHAAVNAHDAEAVAALCCGDIAWEDAAGYAGTLKLS